MKKITIDLTDKQHCLLSRIAKEDKRKLQDLVYMTIAAGLGSVFCERPFHVEKTPDEYSEEDRKQIAKNEKLEKSKGWEDLTWDEKREKGFKHVRDWLSNCNRDQKDFVEELSESIESNIYKGETA